MRARLCQWVAVGEHTTLGIDQYDESIRVLNAHRVVQAAGNAQAIVVWQVRVYGKFVIHWQVPMQQAPAAIVVQAYPVYPRFSL